MIETVKMFLYERLDSSTAVVAVTLLGIALASVVSYFVCKALLKLVEWIIGKTPTGLDDVIFNNRCMRGVSQLAPALTVNWLLPQMFAPTEERAVAWVKIFTSIYILWVVVYIVNILITNFYVALSSHKRTRPYAVKGIFQMLKLVAICIGIIVCISILLGKQPMVILTALGASAAVLSLVFKDTILGLVASVQLTANNMMQRGDWVAVDRYNANGEVIDISLTTVKIRNWDNTVTTIPPYALVSDSFRSYEPMVNSGGRRVERAVYIDVNSVRVLSETETASLAERNLIAPADGNDVVNLTLFRRHLERYLEASPLVNHSMTCMVRQMDPTPSGLPLQLYFFTDTTAWVKFEHIQSDIFDYVYAIVQEFGLRIFQTPSGRDVSEVRCCPV